MVDNPRPYRGLEDLEAMRAFVRHGREAGAPADYPHVGDLAWWIFYLNQAYAPEEHVFLWEDAGGGLLRGWAMVSPQHGVFDVFVRPDQWQHGAANAMCVWAEERFAMTLGPGGDTGKITMWGSERDSRLIAHLESRGFAPSEDVLIRTSMRVAASLEAPALPPGFRLRTIAGVQEAEARAAAGHAAFTSKLPWDQYRRRYRRFMESPVYSPDNEVVVEAPDGRIAGFCIAWPDTVSGEGLLEPVGVHPDFQRRRLGRAVVLEALRRLAQRGMTKVAVSFYPSNPAARALYLGVGFEAQYRVRGYSKQATATDDPVTAPPAWA
jgi:ribosomal protein S18 acetylase RimI-like enzyme